MSNLTLKMDFSEITNQIPDILDTLCDNQMQRIDAGGTTPYWTGATKITKTKYIYKNKAAIVWRTPYASDIYQDTKRKFRKSANAPNARAKWALKDVSSDPSDPNEILYKNELDQDFANEIKRRGGS